MPAARSRNDLVWESPPALTGTGGALIRNRASSGGGLPRLGGATTSSGTGPLPSRVQGGPSSGTAQTLPRSELRTFAQDPTRWSPTLNSILATSHESEASLILVRSFLRYSCVQGFKLGSASGGHVRRTSFGQRSTFKGGPQILNISVYRVSFPDDPPATNGKNAAELCRLSYRVVQIHLQTSVYSTHVFYKRNCEACCD